MTIEESRTIPSDRPSRDRPVIAIAGLMKSFDGRVVIDNVDLRVMPGSIVTIIGQSGGGKSTLLRCVNLLERPDSGSIDVAGEPVFAGTRVVCRDLARLRQSVGMVFQRFNLFPHLTAVENVMLAQMKAAGASTAQATETAVRLLRRVHLAHRALAFPEQMSGGEQQRVAIARALALQPKVLLFDEPTSALDPESTREVLQVMRELADDGMTMLIVTHEVPFARRIADSVVFLDGGRIIEQGTAAQVLDHPTHPRTKAFLESFGDLDDPRVPLHPVVDVPDRAD
jgi:ABC-type polar amino acid transport system ATPase subunit